MRVIAGKAKRLPLKTIAGMDTRPTTDRIKETLFNMLQDDIYGCRFLDLFSGSGAIGIEALSRGAREAVFVENSRKACGCISENLKFTKLEASARLLSMDVFQALSRLSADGVPFDIIFMDPPYERELEKKVLTQLVGSSLITEETLLVTEASLETDFSYLPSLGYEILKRKEYKTNVHLFLQRTKGADL